MKYVRGEWVDYHLLWEDHGSKVKYRPAEDVSRLRELRMKQQPDADWSVDWDNFILKNEVSKDDVYVAKKVSSKPFDESFLTYEVTDYTYVAWDTPRVKAILRSGKMLPYDILRRINPRTKWTAIQQMISITGDLPDISYAVMEAVNEVNNQGYREALDRVLAGGSEHSDRAKRVQEDRACDLVAAILRGWEAQERANSGRKKPGVEIFDEQDKEWMYQES